MAGRKAVLAALGATALAVALGTPAFADPVAFGGAGGGGGPHGPTPGHVGVHGKATTNGRGKTHTSSDVQDSGGIGRAGRPGAHGTTYTFSNR